MGTFSGFWFFPVVPCWLDLSQPRYFFIFFLGGFLHIHFDPPPSSKHQTYSRHITHLVVYTANTTCHIRHQTSDIRLYTQSWWTRRPIVKVTMGCRTEPAAVHIAHVLQRLHFFQFFNFFYILHDVPQKKKITHPYRKKKNSIFFIIHRTYRKKKNYTHLPQKKITQLDDFFCTRVTFFTL